MEIFPILILAWIFALIYGVSMVIVVVEVIYYNKTYKTNAHDTAVNIMFILTPIVNTVAAILVLLDIYKYGWVKHFK